MIYVTGDTHGDRERLSRRKLRHLKEGDTLIICGDFGFMWNDSRREQRFLRSLGKRKYNICFIVIVIVYERWGIIFFISYFSNR